MYRSSLPTDAPVSDATEDVRGTYEMMVRDRQTAGREVPAVPIHLDGLSSADRETVRQSVEASQELYRRAQRHSFTVGIDLKALEARRVARAVPPQAVNAKRKRRKRV